ncbi:hypothetical protein BJV82DRAFT_504949 [Fennellomyces sp. T-0311]|nr:hypothetical protein BJV82DRAFT_504949 [Fennellomyces sp. T-0311]
MDIETAIVKLIESIQSVSHDDLHFRLEILRTMKRIFAAHPSTRDTFRQSGGYVTLISMIVGMEGSFADPQKYYPSATIDQLLDLLQEVFHALGASMRNNDMNKQFFRTQVGYGALENSVRLTGGLESAGAPRSIFGILFGFAIDTEGRTTDLFVSTTENERLADHVEAILKQISVTVINPEIATSILHLQKLVSFDPDLSDAILCGIYALARSNRRNQVRLNKSGLMLAALDRILPLKDDDNDDAPLQEKQVLLNVVKKLMTMGISYEEIRHVFQGFNNGGTFSALHNDIGGHLMDLILDGASRSRWPNFIQFDMSCHGFSCLEIPSLPNFPQSSPGYTLLTWFHIERMDAVMPLTLLTLLDTDNIPVLKIIIDPASGRLQMHQAGVKQYIEFAAFDFQPGYWYHLALVHQRARLGINLSTMSLYVNDDVLILYFNLGARYKSLFQDALRQFQTYEASTTLFLSLRAMTKTFSRRDMDQSLLANVMRGAGSASVDESKFVLAFFASNDLMEGPHTGLTTSGLSTPALQLILASTKQAQLVLNSAIPKIEASITSPRAMGYLDGNPVVATPYGVDESMWRIGGSAVALTLIERSETSEMLFKATKVLCETIRYSWRNSEDMERCHGYEILAYLLKQKRELITVELMEVLLLFIGKDPVNPEDSLISNPFAYRYILLNFEVWKKTPLEVQKAHLAQFTLFLRTSKKRHFNLKRLQKFHLVKRMLLAFRMHIYSKSLTADVVAALKAVTICSWNTESIRAIATFLASTVSRGSVHSQQKHETH